MVGWNTGATPASAREIMKEALETGKITETNQIDDAELKRLRLIIRERDRIIDGLLAIIKEQHEQLVFKVENRTPVD